MSSPPTATSARALTVPGLRWVMAAGLVLLSMLNYVDRQALSVLAPTIQRELGLSDLDYGRIGQTFLVCYTLAYFWGGRIVDRIGPRLAETVFVVVWSTANVLVGWVQGFGSLLGARALLGLAEPGHYAAAAKVVGSWFPANEKGVAVGLYVMGGTLGAAVSAPLVSWLALRYGWRAAFVATGVMGLVAAVVWWSVYRSPIEHPWLGMAERTRLQASGVLDRAADPTGPTPLSTLLTWKPLWLLLVVRALTDPVWHFYLVWFAKYQQERLGFSLSETGATLWLVFVAADLGCLAAGIGSGWWIRRGVTPWSARLRVMAPAAALMSLSWLMPVLSGKAWPLILACGLAFSTLTFMSSAVTLVVDLFPAHSVGSVQGVIGMGGSLSGAVTTGLVAWVVTHDSYDTVFRATSILHPLAFLLAFALLPRFVRKREAAAS